MQKSKLNANVVGVAAHSDPQIKNNTKPVGAAISRPHFEEMTQNKGITLIALIITIIVMLILVGVTINVALNGGLFQKASEASEQMQIEAEKEELLSAVVASIGNDGKVGNIVLPEGWFKLADGNYRSPKDNIYKVYDDGKIEYIGKYTGGGSEPVAFTWASVNLANVDTSAEYKGYIAALNMTGIISFTEDGRIIMNANGVSIEKDAKDEKNIDKATRNLSFSIELMEGIDSNIIITMNENNTDIDFQVVGVETVKCVKQGKTIYSNEEVLKMLGVLNSTGTYNGTWTVIESDADGNPTKLVSTSAVANCTLGEEDNLEKSISDYKNAVSILNTSAQQATGIASARSINVEDIETLAGIEDSDKGDNYNQPYTYNYTNHKDQIFVNESGATVKLDAEGKEVTLKHTYYYKELSSNDIGILASDYYWLASPCVDCSSNRANFYVRFMNNGNISNGYLFDSNGYASGISRGVRAVVSVSGL